MRGYVQNEGTQAYFVCQRQIPPGGKVQLEDVYTSVGKKSGLEDGLEFVEWIKDNVFRRGSWTYYEKEGKPLDGKPKNKAVKKTIVKNTSSPKTSSKKSSDARGAGRSLRRDANESQGIEITPHQIIEAPYESARGLIDKTKDKTVLRKALKLTNHFNGKEPHMRHILKRLEQV